ncbi:MAG: GatB/YqeY domain-containing protein [candidate division Zixibacteria bacterium]|nr:GatB/YqeY domain-containing protein [candidate division Zixibacteria bacterium]
MSILKKIDDNIIKALKNGEKEKLTVLRGLKSELKYKQIDKGDDLTDDDIIAVLSSAAKKRRESIDQYNNADRTDLADKESIELKIIEQYLPEQLDESKLRQIVADAIEETGADSPQKIGLIMKVVMPKIKGQADGKMVNKLVIELLNKTE